MPEKQFVGELINAVSVSSTDIVRFNLLNISCADFQCNCRYKNALMSQQKNEKNNMKSFGNWVISMPRIIIFYTA